MARLSTLLILILLVLHGFAQTSDLVFFTDDGAKFILLIDGDQKNNEPAARVVATGIRTETPVVMVRFADSSIPQLKKSGYFGSGKEYTVMITTNKKGERVLRPSGEAALGTAASKDPVKPIPTEFREDPPAVVVEPATSVPSVITTTTVVEEVGGSNEKVDINMGVNGVDINMSVNVDDGTGETTTTTTRTTTTSTTSTTGMIVTPPATKPVVKEPAVHSMPGYTGRIGCDWPMSDPEFTEAKKSIEGKSFEDTKMTLAKQVGSGRCFTVDQVKGLMDLFGFEDSKLDFAKYAYERTYDIDNYYRVNDAFSFESSVDELNEYIQAR
jgi:hypothetical protein